MGKRIYSLLVVGCIMTFLVGCGDNKAVQDNKESIVKDEAPAQEVTQKENTQEEKHTLVGTISEKKDFMFVLEDDEKKPYAFAFSDKPEGYDNLKVDDKVTVEYTGEISEVDAFTGQVLSVTKNEDQGKQKECD